MNLISEDYLMHHGVKGMKWGVRHGPQRSVKGTLHRGLSKVYGVNERYYRKTGNKTLASMNAQAKNAQLKKAAVADKNAGLSTKQKKMIKKVAIGAAVVAGVGLAAYGGYKFSAIRSYNKAAVGKLLAKHEDIKISALKGAPSNFKNITDSSKLSISTNATVKKTILGPSLKGSRSTVQKYGEGTIRGPRFEKELEKFSAGRGGRNNPIVMPKNERKAYARLYDDLTKGKVETFSVGKDKYITDKNWSYTTLQNYISNPKIFKNKKKR